MLGLKGICKCLLFLYKSRLFTINNLYALYIYMERLTMYVLNC